MIKKNAVAKNKKLGKTLKGVNGGATAYEFAYISDGLAAQLVNNPLIFKKP